MHGLRAVKVNSQHHHSLQQAQPPHAKDAGVCVCDCTCVLCPSLVLGCVYAHQCFLPGGFEVPRFLDRFEKSTSFFGDFFPIFFFIFFFFFPLSLACLWAILTKTGQNLLLCEVFWAAGEGDFWAAR